MSNSNHDPKNKECLLNHLDTICFPSGNVRPVLHIDRDMNGKKFVCPYSVCTCPEQNMEEKKCMCGEHQLGYFIISERIGETIHSRESPCWVIEKEDHTKCRKLGASDLCVCCPCGCDTPMDAPNYAELHGAPTEQKEDCVGTNWKCGDCGEYVDESDMIFGKHVCTEQKEEVVHASGCAADLDGCYDGSCLAIREQKEEWESPSNLQRIFSVDYVTACKIKDFLRTQLALSEERGRDAQQKEDYEIAKAQQEKAFKSGAEMGEERGRREEVRLFMESIQKKAETVTPNLLLNEVVNYAYDRIKTLTQKS